MSNEIGFLHLFDVMERQKTEKILSVQEKEPDDILQRMENQQANNGVVFDLRLGSEIFLSGDEKPRILTDAYPYVTIQSGQFALLTTYEILTMPLDLIAFISMKFGKSSGGLINISGFHVDPGFNGLLIFSVYNAGPRPVILKYKEDVFMIIFSKISKKLEKPPQKIFQNQFHLEAKHWSNLIGTPISPMILSERISKLEMWNKVNWGLALTLIGSIIAVLATFSDKFFQFFGGK